jgi:hypothetical protein
MTLKTAHMLSTSGLPAMPFGPRVAPVELIVKDQLSSGVPRPGGDETDGSAVQATRRTRIWEFGTNLHCSIIGTCLSTAELRQVLEKFEVKGAGTASHHDLHIMGVSLASHREGGAKFIQKALDRRHRSAITRCSRAERPVDLLAFWDESLKQGDVPGAYWAVLTHPATTEDIVKRVFGDVHMLSHLVGAANRADIRRLRQLEQENEALAEKVERQQCRLNEGFAARDQTIRQLNELLARQSNERSERPSASEEHDKHDLDGLFQGFNRRLVRETVRRERAEQQANKLSAALEEKERLLRTYEEERGSYREELEAAERQLAMLIQTEAPRSQAPLDFSGITFLYVGGRPHQVPGFKTMVERTGARFLHHDGGIEDSPNLIPGLISRADRVFFPVDCISHDAVGTIKRLCRLMTKPYEPLRTASLSCLLSALTKASVGCKVISP